MPDVSASSSFSLLDSNSNGDLKIEAAECRRHGYILSGKFLGQGAYAKVYLGQATRSKINTNMKLRCAAEASHKELKVAIKIISSETAPKIYISKFLPREIATMNRCYKHLNVVQLYDIFATSKRVYLILELATSGDLLTYINKCCVKNTLRSVPENSARTMFTEIAAGLRFIHRRGIAHRDLKCENVLLTGDYSIKLSDFGFAIDTTESRELLKTHCGSYAYASPEILRQQKYDGRKADLWSLGVVLFAMVNGGLPFKESDAKAVLAAMKKPVYFKNHLSTECKELIRGLLRIKPQKRFTIDEVLCHSWITKFEHPDCSLILKVPSHSEIPTIQRLADEDMEKNEVDEEDIVKQQYAHMDDPVNVSRYLLQKMKPGQANKMSRYYTHNTSNELPIKNVVKTCRKKDPCCVLKETDNVPRETETTDYSPPEKAIHPAISVENDNPLENAKTKKDDKKSGDSVILSSVDKAEIPSMDTEPTCERVKKSSEKNEITAVSDLIEMHCIPTHEGNKKGNRETIPKQSLHNARPRAWVSSRGDNASTFVRNSPGRETASPNVINIRIDRITELNSNMYNEYQRMRPRKNATNEKTKPVKGRGKILKNPNTLNREKQANEEKLLKEYMEKDEKKLLTIYRPTGTKQVQLRRESENKIKEPEQLKFDHVPVKINSKKKKETNGNSSPSRTKQKDKSASPKLKSNEPKSSNLNKFDEKIKEYRKTIHPSHANTDTKHGKNSRRNQVTSVTYASRSSCDARKRFTPTNIISQRHHLTTASNDATPKGPCKAKSGGTIADVNDADSKNPALKSPTTGDVEGEFVKMRPFSRKIRGIGAGEWYNQNSSHYLSHQMYERSEWEERKKDSMQGPTKVDRFPNQQELLNYKFVRDEKAIRHSKQVIDSGKTTSDSTKHLPCANKQSGYRIRTTDQQSSKKQVCSPRENCRIQIFHNLQRNQDYYKAHPYTCINPLQEEIACTETGRLLYKRLRKQHISLPSKPQCLESTLVLPKRQKTFLPVPSCGLTARKNTSKRSSKSSSLYSPASKRNFQHQPVVLKLHKS